MTMRLAALTMVRNEEDILEASVRHNLTVLDSLVVVDHESDDATPDILASLVEEGLPIEVQHEDWMGFGSAESATRHLRSILAGGAGACLTLDADEFLRIRSRQAFDAAVVAAAPERYLAIPRFTYMPAFDAHGQILERLRDARRIATSHAGPGSVIVHRMPPETRDAPVDSRDGRAGSDGSTAAACEVMPSTVAAVAHVPIRSAEQFIAEVALLHVACALAAGSGTKPAFRWQDELAAIKAGRPLTPEQLTTIAANFGAPAESAIPFAGIRWVDDPFLADIRLAYTPATPPQALGLVLALGERIALAIARATGGM
jgi:hypothetical protein